MLVALASWSLDDPAPPECLGRAFWLPGDKIGGAAFCLGIALDTGCKLGGTAFCSAVFGVVGHSAMLSAIGFFCNGLAFSGLFGKAWCFGENSGSGGVDFACGVLALAAPASST